MVDWPSTLPQFKLSGIKDQRQGGRIRSNVDAGPALVRRRYTATVRNVDIPMTFTNAERILMDTFYGTTLQEGSISFNWTDPVTGSVVTYRFRDTGGPDWQAVEGGPQKRWNVVLNLEIMP